MKPGVRVNWTRLVVRTLANRGPGVRERVLERISPEARQQLDGAGPVSWLDLAYHLDVCEAVRAELGDPGYREHFCEATVKSGRFTLFRPLVQGFLRMFGPTPASTVKASPRAWTHIFRGLGQLEVGTEGDRSIEASIRHLHVSLRDTETFVFGVHGAYDACLEFVGYRGDVTIDTHDLASGDAHYRITWTGPV